MLINWFTVFAQVFNFLILVALLRWFLYQPILKVMQKRQTLIAERWQEAERLQAEAQQTLATYQHQQQELHQQQATWLAEARLAADQERQRLLAQVRQAIAEQRAAWQTELHQEQTAFLRTLRQNVIHQTYAIARQALKDLANADLEAQLVQVFCDRLRQLETPQHQAIAQALSQTNQPILIQSSFELPLALRQQVTEALRTQFEIAQPIEFVTTSDLFCGIEIKLAGQEIVWSFDTYLQTLEQRLSNALTQEETSHHEPHFSAGAGCLL
ncbi:MAG TPA: F0F1 ATP synthase subunit B [Leptolyngbyaceae cyanobacterium M33_DOE_097]|uniref:ATP synthase subunit b n=1 Tax=Oscillatoriales cyanobacterium SpSt-418 TaxID=2282169 RepID=A0A7C3KF11_9CYAN|nr:F0F1 ATP synthase subunit B [Leptolyngbyaceae cyanobacterium M33_DOE_097]